MTARRTCASGRGGGGRTSRSRALIRRVYPQARVDGGWSGDLLTWVKDARAASPYSAWRFIPAHAGGELWCRAREQGMPVYPRTRVRVKRVNPECRQTRFIPMGVGKGWILMVCEGICRYGEILVRRSRIRVYLCGAAISLQSWSNPPERATAPVSGLSCFQCRNSLVSTALAGFIPVRTKGEIVVFALRPVGVYPRA